MSPILIDVIATALRNRDLAAGREELSYEDYTGDALAMIRAYEEYEARPRVRSHFPEGPVYLSANDR